MIYWGNKQIESINNEIETIKKDNEDLHNQLHNLVPDIRYFETTSEVSSIAGWIEHTITINQVPEGKYWCDISTSGDINGIGLKQIIHTGENVNIKIGVNGKGSNDITLNVTLYVLVPKTE